MLEVCRALGRADEVGGFVEENTQRAGQLVKGRPILDASDAALRAPDARFVGAMGSPLRRAFIERVTAGGGRFETLVHPHASVGGDVMLGEGAFVAQGVMLTTDVTIGRHALLNVGAIVHHDCRVGDYATIGPRACLAGRVSVGEGAYLGMGAMVKPRVSVGEGAFVGAGALVTRDVPPGTLAYGVPARPIRKLSDEDWVTLP